MRTLALLPALGLAGCCDCPMTVIPSLEYKVDVIELQTPCPSKCSTLEYELSDDEDGKLRYHADIPYGDWGTTDSRIYDSSGDLYFLDLRMGRLEDPYTTLPSRPYPPGGLRGRGFDCEIQFLLTVEPEPTPLGVWLNRINWRGWDKAVLALDEGQLNDEDFGWTLALVGDFPLPTADNEDYEAQIFHIVGGPDERVTPAEDACDDDPRSFWFDLQFTPVSPPQGPQR